MFIIFDSQQLCYSAFYSMGGLVYEDEGTGIIFGFLKQLFSIAKIFKKHKPILIFAWDSKLNYRKQFYHNYKKKRKEKKQKSGLTSEHYKQFDLLRKDVLPSIGYKNIFIQPGFEADDIIALICNKYQLEKKIIVSSDEDLYQLLDIETSMYKIKPKKLYTNDDWFKEHGQGNLVTTDWIKIKALAGCSTDEVKGIKGVGEKTAGKYLAGNLKKTSKAYQSIITKRNQLLYNRNIPLVTIPYPYKQMKDIKIKKNKPNFEDFYAMCLEYNFKSIIQDIKRWRKILKLK